MIDDLPATIRENPEALHRALAALNADLTPPTPEQFSVATLDFFLWANAFGVGGNLDVEGTARLYRAALSDIPAPLLRKAFQRIIATWKWPRLPSPADVRDQIRDELGDVLTIKSQLEIAAMKLRREARDAAVREKRWADLDKKKKELENSGLMPSSPASLKKMPGTEPDDISEEEYSRRLAEYRRLAEENSPTS